MSKRRRQAGKPQGATDPRSAELDHALALFRQGDTVEASAACERVLLKQPNCPSALHLKGVLHSGLNQHDLAIACLQRAIAADPEYVTGRIDLGRMLNDVGRFDEAADVLQHAVSIHPDQVQALNNLGISLKHLQRFPESIAVLQRAIQLKPDYIHAILNLGYTQAKADELPAAVDAFTAVLRINPAHVESLRMLARLYRMMSLPAAAQATYQRWLEVEPNNPVARHMSIAMKGESPPDRASDEYVQQEFDQFARSFDQQLERLDYRAPELVAEVINHHCPDAFRSLEFLDAGCGTGRAGGLFRPFSKRLIGVDLSSGMLERARQSGHYDELHQAELCAYLQQCSNQFDMITIIDALVYFGDLEDVTAAAARPLNNGGRLILTVEQLQGSEEAFRLTANGRYCHRQDYVDRVLRLAGFRELECQKIVLRKELNEPVRGLLFCGRVSG